MNSTTEAERPTVGRRSVLKAAAVAGGAVWVAPFVDSRPAAAACPATVKCNPNTIAFSAVLTTECTNAGTFNRALVTISWSEALGAWCPCGATSASVCRDAVNGSIWNNGILTATVAGNGTVNTAARTWAVEFLDAGNDLAPGLWTPAGVGQLEIAFSCVDRTGDRVWRVYTLNVSFNYTYAANPCVVGLPAGTATVTVASTSIVCQNACPI